MEIESIGRVAVDGVASADSGTASATSACSVRKDLSEWQERHAYLVLTSVKVCEL